MIVRDRARSAGVALLAILAFLFAVPPGGARADAVVNAPDTVAIGSGQVQGGLGDGYRLFDGIPYAAPPIGDLRWRPPQPPAPWPGVRTARTAGPSCPQQTGIGGPRSNDEDCLYLNVWTPRTLPSDRALPVMVWLHGGGFESGSGSMYGAAPLISQPDGDSIVVTVNYRLGAFGFLAASALDEGAGAGDYGLMDQQAALRWVQRNIGAFGGDAGRVTVAGESAGAIAICAQLAAPSSAGLFQAAIMESGPCSAQSLPQAEKAGDAWAQRNGCPGPGAAACLRALPAAQLVDQPLDPSNAVYGNAFLPQDPTVALKSGASRPVPTLVGSNHDEMALWAWMKYGIPFGSQLAAADYPQALVTSLDITPAQADRVQQEYPLTAFPQPAQAITRAWTDDMVCGASEEKAEFGRRSPTYVYEFDDPAPVAPPSTFPMGAYHASELPSLFDLAEAGGFLNGVMSPDQRRLAAEMRRYWMHFVIDHRADPAGLPAIPQYDSGSAQFISFRPAGSVIADSFDADHRCDFWSGLTP
ncbi:carboxylesterase/lipase family protein [Nocardia sp. NPDC020380]|uniref:carboxylesterase/lipase family protein n=1 Tax=Nocardia sp. NPDC020380 TaxID=3364309 RepID=UPI0037B377F3